ncbi:hypothetical protein SDC9_165028 [bioreactor metagenome]|uniref:GLUG domain-containing protein n=1 Tax=bioreactor metagenome TaxID=1076179 RepID=A0A645G0I2_9ZZZZ
MINGGSIIATASGNGVYAQTLAMTGGTLTGSADDNDAGGVYVEKNISVSGTASLIGWAYGDGGTGVYAGGNITVDGASSLTGSASSGCGIMARGNINVVGAQSRVIASSSEYGTEQYYGAIVADGDIGGVIDQPDGANVLYFPYADNKLKHNTVISRGAPAETVTLTGIDAVQKTKLPPVMVIAFVLVFVVLGSTMAIVLYRKIEYESKRWI